MQHSHLMMMVVTGTVWAACLPAAAQTRQQPQVVQQAFPEIVEQGRFVTPPVTPLTVNRPELFRGSNELQLAPVTAERIAEADAARAQRYGHIQPGPKRVGIVRGADLRFEHHGREAFIDGTAVRTMSVRTPDALGTRLHLTEFDAGRSKVIIYAPSVDGVVGLGPFSGRGPEDDGDFWTATLPGDRVYIEVSGPDEPTFKIAQIAHLDHDTLNTSPTAGYGVDYAPSLSCHLDVTCFTPPDGARQGTGRMVYAEDGSCFTCTGTLLADNDPDTVVMYFLTAYHCVSTQAAVNSLEVRWFYQSNTCNGFVPPASSVPANVGGVLLETSETIFGNDMAFMRLNGPVQPGLGFAGWTTASLDNGIGIHHPGGSPKSISFLTSDSDACLSPLQYDYYELTSGAIEGGSSGSGIFNTLGQLSGQLYGWCLALDTPVCSSQGDYSLQYGEFEETLECTNFWLQHLGGTIRVDGTASPPGNGSPADPYPTVTAGYNAAWDGTRLAIAGDYYPELLTLTKKITLVSDGGTVLIGQ